MWIVEREALWTPLACTVAAAPIAIYTANQFSTNSTPTRWLWLAIAIALMAFGSYASYARYRWDRAQSKAAAESPWGLENFVQYFQTPVIQIASESVACWLHCIPRHHLRELRMEILSAVANSVGRSGSPGTRANIFEFHADGGSKELRNTEYFKGRGKRSGSKFGPTTPTFRDTLCNLPRFEPYAGKGNEYETYMTMPIVAGPNIFYGALTVDALKSGQLDEALDLPVMRYWAAMFAVTYALEGFKPVEGYCGDPS